jgi:hypothetical protein
MKGMLCYEDQYSTSAMMEGDKDVYRYILPQITLSI